MTVAALDKAYKPSSQDGFFDLEPAGGKQNASLALARAALLRGAEASTQSLHELTSDVADGVYALSRADAADLNVIVDLPEQPLYDWSDFRDPDEDD